MRQLDTTVHVEAVDIGGLIKQTLNVPSATDASAENALILVGLGLMMEEIQCAEKTSVRIMP